MPFYSNLRILFIDNNPEAHKDFISLVTANSENKTEQTAPSYQIDSATNKEELCLQISKAVKESNPYALAFVNLPLPNTQAGIEMIKDLRSLDPDVQLLVCAPHLDQAWEEAINRLEKDGNLLILEKPLDPLIARQLTQVLTKKWSLMKDVGQYAHLLDKKNNRLVTEHIHQEIIKAKNNNLMFGVLSFEFDFFKLIQSGLNQEAAKQLMENVVLRIQATLRDSDELIQLDNNKFVALITACKSLDVLKPLAEKISANLDKPFTVMDREIVVSPNIGISIFPKDGISADELITNADLALHNVQDSKVNFYKSELSIDNIELLKLEADLQNAIVNKELFISYQPQYDTSSDKYTSVEALIRWNHPKKGLLLPMHFIALAEETGLIVPIGEWILKEVCTQNKAWQELGLPPIRVAVNLSTSQFKQHDLAVIIKNILNETHLSPEHLELELSETAIINNPEAAAILSQLHEAGVYITLDDFNPTATKDDYLRSIHLDRLKISRSLVQNIGIIPSDETSIQNIVTLAKNLDLEIIAEGVETQKQLDFLRAIQCNSIQGFYFNKPLTAHEVENLLRNPAKIEQSASSYTLRLA